MSTEEQIRQQKQTKKQNKQEVRMEHKIIPILYSASLCRHFNVILSARRQGNQNKTHSQNIKEYMFLERKKAEGEWKWQDKDENFPRYAPDRHPGC